MTQLFVQTLGRNEHVLQAISQGRPAIVKVVNPDLDWVVAINNASPNTLIVGRWQPPHEWILNAPQGRQHARFIINKTNELGGRITHWEGSNEAASGLESIKRLNSFELAFAQTLNEVGLHPIVGGFSTGIPNIVGTTLNMKEWEAFYPAMQEAWGVHFHEYWDPFMLDDTWNAYRYQKWWPALPDWAREKWWLISELGVDGGVAGEPGEGWKTYMTTDDFLGLLVPYAVALQEYPRIASTIFCAGLGVDQHWESFDIAGTLVLDRLKNSWLVSDYRWGDTETAPQPDVVELDRMLERRLAAVVAGPSDAAIDELDEVLEERLDAIGIEYENLIGHRAFPDDPGATWFRDRDLGDLAGFAFHHSAGSPLGSTLSIYNANVERGLGGIAYHFIGYCARTSSGHIWRKLRMMRNPLQQGAHVKGENHKWIGYCWPGRWDEIPPDMGLLESQAEMYKIVHKTVREWLGFDALDLQSHREILPGHTVCPDNDLWFRSQFVPLLETEPDPPTPDCNESIDAILNLIEGLYKEIEGLKT